jgi:hypothetical protein
MGKTKASGKLHFLFLLVLFSFPGISDAEYVPNYIQYGRYHNFIYNPAYTGNGGIFTGSYYMSNPGILLGFELAPKNWSNAMGYVYDQVGDRHDLLFAFKKIRLGEKSFLRFGTSGAINTSFTTFNLGLGALLQVNNLRAGVSLNDILQINHGLYTPISSYYTISYDIKGDHALWMPQVGMYTDYHFSTFYTAVLNVAASYVVMGGGFIIAGNTLNMLLNCGVKIKNNALLLGVDGFPVNGHPELDKRFSTYHLILRIQI